MNKPNEQPALADLYVDGDHLRDETAFEVRRLHNLLLLSECSGLSAGQRAAAMSSVCRFLRTFLFATYGLRARVGACGRDLDSRGACGVLDGITADKTFSSPPAESTRSGSAGGLFDQTGGETANLPVNQQRFLHLQGGTSAGQRIPCTIPGQNASIAVRDDHSVRVLSAVKDFHQTHRRAGSRSRRHGRPAQRNDQLHNRIEGALIYE